MISYNAYNNPEVDILTLNWHLKILKVKNCATYSKLHSYCHNQDSNPGILKLNLIFFIIIDTLPRFLRESSTFTVCFLTSYSLLSYLNLVSVFTSPWLMFPVLLHRTSALTNDLSSAISIKSYLFLFWLSWLLSKILLFFSV